MQEDNAFSKAREIMLDFAGQTGLSPAGANPRRYLWTDAFAVCNFLALHRLSGDETFKELALVLVDQVHDTLGRHRPDDPRRGWISGLDEAAGRLHPTAGGLRIGKKLNERGPDEPFADELEWDRDGQYYHYLTKWMHALNQVSSVTSAPVYNVWAKEMARAVHAGFVADLGGQKYLPWKMSIDLSRSLVPATGQHDPLDGFITYHQLQACGPQSGGDAPPPNLSREIRELAGMCRGRDLATDDTLGIGGLLCSACALARLLAAGHATGQSVLLREMLAASLTGLQAVASMNIPALPAGYRLAFRELGLSIGMHGAERLLQLLADKSSRFAGAEQLSELVARVLGYAPLARALEDFWLVERNREAATWSDHGDINMVMLATSLVPDGFLGICGHELSNL